MYQVTNRRKAFVILRLIHVCLFFFFLYLVENAESSISELQDFNVFSGACLLALPPPPPPPILSPIQNTLRRPCLEVLGTLRSEDEDGYEYEFSVLSMRIRFDSQQIQPTLLEVRMLRTDSGMLSGVTVYPLFIFFS